jgi:hypothetical protein
MKIGVDLGTTNSAVADIDEREAEDRDFPPILFETPQLFAPGRTEPRRTLPLFLFLADSRSSRSNPQACRPKSGIPYGLGSGIGACQLP